MNQAETPTHCGKEMQRSEIQSGRPWWCRVCGGTKAGNVFTPDPLAPSLPPSPPPPTLPSLGDRPLTYTIKEQAYDPTFQLRPPHTATYAANGNYADAYDAICQHANKEIGKLCLPVSLVLASSKVTYRTERELCAGWLLK